MHTIVFKNPCIDNFGFSVVMFVAVFIKSGLLLLFDAEGALDGNFIFGYERAKSLS